MKPTAIIVSFHSVNWIRNSLESFHKILPEINILVVDNNPKIPECINEKKYLNSLPWITTIRTPHPNTIHRRGSPHFDHGKALDYGIAWCKNKFDLALHIEPDCLTLGRAWFEKMVNKIKEGYWMVGSKKFSFGPIHPTPSLWRIDKIKHSFSQVPKKEDINHPLYPSLFNHKILKDINDPDYMEIREKWYEEHWDTGFKNWFECAINQKSSCVNIKDFIHFEDGTYNSEETVKAKYKLHGIQKTPVFPTKKTYRIY